MNPADLAWSRACVCGRTFAVPHGFSYHQRSCLKAKKRLSDALEKGREVLRARKRRKIDLGHQVVESSSNQSVPAEAPSNDDSLLLDCPQVRIRVHSALSFIRVLQCVEVPSAVDHEDLDQSLAERRGPREHCPLPKSYRDMLPEPPTALPVPVTNATPSVRRLSHFYIEVPSPPVALSEYKPLSSCSISLSQRAYANLSTSSHSLRKILTSACNGFGLFRQYYATHFPDHDPAQNISSHDLIYTSPTILTNVYHPYPNQSSFLLGEWYWNGGEKKSQLSFQRLLEIVGHPAFHPEDVAGNNWRRIDAQLSGDGRESPNNGDSWVDEENDRDWIKTPIRISVPFHKRTSHPGPKEFDAGVLYHRKLTSVIREKITWLSIHPHLHFEPYEYFWQPNKATEPVRVYGELYTSEAFSEAHCVLQDSPGEPGCELPRVVLGLKLASDSTHLTAFSSAKLCPVYLAIGNESKDRQAFEHIAYLEAVR